MGRETDRAQDEPGAARPPRGAGRSATPRKPRKKAARALVPRVPAVSALFWVAAALALVLGRSVGDYLYATVATDPTTLFLLSAAALLTGVLARGRRPRPAAWSFWPVLVLVGVFGGIAADQLGDQWGLSRSLLAVLAAAGTAALLWWWNGREGDVDPARVVTAPQELTFWAALTLADLTGAALADWTADLTTWNPLQAALVPAGQLLLLYLAWRQGAAAALLFWLTTVFLRPLADSVADGLTADSISGGLGLDPAVSAMISGAALIGVIFFASRVPPVAEV